MSNSESPVVPHQGYRAEVLGNIEHGPGRWDYLRVGVFQEATLLGEYVRNYSSFYQTFYPFCREGVWYALASPHYTATSVLKLPECTVVGGEEPAPNGFCPVEFYVPCYRRWQMDIDGAKESLYLTDSEVEDLWNHTRSEEGEELGPVTYLPFGFVAGCRWGDESSWKVQILDLRDPTQPKRLDSFGYLELPERIPLSRAVQITHIEGEPGEEQIWFDLAIRRRFTFQQEDFSFRTYE